MSKVIITSIFSIVVAIWIGFKVFIPLERNVIQQEYISKISLFEKSAEEVSPNMDSIFNIQTIVNPHLRTSKRARVSKEFFIQEIQPRFKSEEFQNTNLLWTQNIRSDTSFDNVYLYNDIELSKDSSIYFSLKKYSHPFFMINHVKHELIFNPNPQKLDELKKDNDWIKHKRIDANWLYIIKKRLQGW